jgi:hypothetical protein
MDIFARLGKILSQKRLAQIKEDLNYADITITPDVWVGKNLVFSLMISLLVSFVITYVFKNYTYTLVAFGLTVFIYYFAVSTIVGMLADQRAKDVELILPDVLTLIASNLRSGIALDEAVISSARKEFGFFSDRINLVGSKISTGVPIAKAMLELSKGINSSILIKTVNLIVEGLQSGGELSTILEETAADIRDIDILQKEVRSIIFVYAIFIFIAAIITAPVLYAVSSHLSQTLTKLSGEVSVSFLSKNAPSLALGPNAITQDFLLAFAYINLIITSVFGALMISLITRGNEKYGIRYAPLFVAISLILFWVARMIIGTFFQAIKI